ncbi:hypothetical protein [Siccibacter turicensis]|uniref:hypothetical protein n=1 Tax=Siccibacter turicensis TaxID=357233 RepID=UPI00101F4A9B|nr:hypothetical protein [Siccibacter turicensis]
MGHFEEQRESWLQAGWKRGAFIKLDENDFLLNEMPAKLRANLEGKCNVYIVPVLYDCALIEEDFTKEPWAQVLVLWEAEFSGNFAYAKNPRRLHLNVCKDNATDFCLEATALSFYQIDREILLRAIPDASINWKAGHLNMLLDWVSERFRQATFPDNFNTRISVVKKRLEALWKGAAFSEYCSGIYIKLSSFSELPQEEIYTIKVLIVVPFGLNGKDYRKFDKEIAPNMINDLKTRLDAVTGVFVEDVDVMSERQFTKELEREYHRYSLEYYSFKKDDDSTPFPSEFISK